MITRLHTLYEWRHTLRCAVVVTVAGTAGYVFDAANVVWIVIGALIVLQTSRGTPARQGLHALFAAVAGTAAGFLLSRYVTQLEWFLLIVAVITLVQTVILMMRQPESYLVMLQWLLPPLVIITAAGWPAGDEMVLAHRVMMMIAGGALGIISSLLLLPVMPYWEFRMGLCPILKALIRYSSELEKFMHDRNSENQLEKRLHKIENVLCARRNEYPEWVFETGFNRNLRSSFRYVLVQLERVTEAFFSLDFHARQKMDAELFAEVAPQLAVVISKNIALLNIIREFFAGEAITQTSENFTHDITEVQQSLRNSLPASVELLDMSPDYINIAALARDVIDIRELLLQILTGLPIDDIAVTE